MEYGSELMSKIQAAIAKKINLFHSSFGRYAVRAIFATAFLTLGTAIAFGVAMKGEEIAHGLGKMLYAFMFSWSLVMIIYLNAELATSNMMYMTVGVYKKKVSVPLALKVLFTCLLFNLIGGVVFGYAMSLTSPFQHLAENSFVYSVVTSKLEKGALQIFIEGIFANMVVNIAVLATMRMKDDIGKIFSLLFIIYIFAFLGFEHVVANFVSMPVAFFASKGTLAAFTAGNVVKNITLAFLGNYVGGGLVMGLTYAWLNDNSHTKFTYLD